MTRKSSSVIDFASQQRTLDVLRQLVKFNRTAANEVVEAFLKRFEASDLQPSKDPELPKAAK